MRLVRGDHFLGDFGRHEIVVREFHRVASAALRHGDQFVRVAEHFRKRHLRLDHHAARRAIRFR